MAILPSVSYVRPELAQSSLQVRPSRLVPGRGSCSSGKVDSPCCFENFTWSRFTGISQYAMARVSHLGPIAPIFAALASSRLDITTRPHVDNQTGDLDDQSAPTDHALSTRCWKAIEPAKALPGLEFVVFRQDIFLNR